MVEGQLPAALRDRIAVFVLDLAAPDVHGRWAATGLSASAIQFVNYSKPWIVSAPLRYGWLNGPAAGA
jgi:hypothetical protein